MRGDPASAPYKASRAALREFYGARAIDARAPQSSLDQTPSGRMKYLQEQAMNRKLPPGMTPDEFANRGMNERWNSMFPYQTGTDPMTPNLPPQAPIPAPKPIGLLPQLLDVPDTLMAGNTAVPLNGYQSPLFRNLTRNQQQGVSYFG